MLLVPEYCVAFNLYGVGPGAVEFISTYMIHLSVQIYAFAVFLYNTACSATVFNSLIPELVLHWRFGHDGKWNGCLRNVSSQHCAA